MTKYYLMAQKVPDDGTVITQMSHYFTELKTGNLFPDDFEEPFVCQLLGEFADGVMSTFYMSPAIIGTSQFYQDLRSCGVDNIQTKQVVINDVVHNRVIEDYLLLNIIGRVSCANMDESEYENIGEDMNVINKLVIDQSKVHDLNLFLVHEDTDCIVINDKVYNCLAKKGYTDISFEEIDQV